MSFHGAIPSEFLDRARHEAERYGDDPWILLRELVQNSRDAGATAIEFRAYLEGNDLIFECRDDGHGMSRSDIERYLLRLYASNKGHGSQDASARATGKVGRFGVGFWSILLFRPAQISIRSDDGSAASGFDLDVEQRALTEFNSASSEKGTTIILRRRASDDDRISKIALALKKYAGAVTGLAGRAAVTLHFNGVDVRDDFEKKTARDGHFGSMEISGKGFRGGVGLGRAPVVRLYAHGLLIREATALDELLPRQSIRSVQLPGLYPVVHINADGLDVLMNRQAVVEDALLSRLIAASSKAVWQLQTKLLDKVAPVALLPRLRLLVVRPARLVALLLLSIFVLGLAVVAGAVLGVESSLFSRFAPSTSSTAGTLNNASPRRASSAASVTTEKSTTTTKSQRPRTVDDISRVANSSVVNNLDNESQLPPWGMQFSGQRDVFFRAAILTEFDSQRGFFAAPHTPVRALNSKRRFRRRQRGQVKIILDAPADDAPLILPTPFGSTVDESSVFIDGVLADVAASNAGGIAVVTTPRLKPSVIRYHTYLDERAILDATAMKPVAPNTWWPKKWKTMFRAAKRKTSVRQKAQLVSNFARENIRYTTSAEDARRFSQSKKTWLQRTLDLEIGDCDVLNGVTVAALRSLNIPARLVVGLVGRRGAIAPVLHAWTEVYDKRAKRWLFFDASPPRVSSTMTVLTPDQMPVGVRPDDANVPLGAPSNNALVDAEVEPSSEKPIFVDDKRTTAITSSFALSNLSNQWRIALAIIALIFTAICLLVLAAALFAIRRGRSRPGDDPILEELVRHLVLHRGGPDPLRLRMRPFFPTLRRKEISLARAENDAARDELFFATKENPWANVVRGTIVDADDPRVKSLIRAVAATDLAPLALVDDLDATPTDAHLNAIAPSFRRAIPHVRLRDAPGTNDVREVVVRTARGERLFIFVDVDRGTRENTGSASFALAHFIVSRASSLSPYRDALLADLAQADLAARVSRRPRGSDLEEANS